MAETKKKICILGLGHVGIVLAVTFEEAGFDVFGIEKNPQTINAFSRGQSPFYENGLTEALRRALKGSFTMLNKLDKPIADVYIVSVGTPIGSDHRPRFEDLVNVSHDIGRVLKRGDLVTLRSTVAPRVTRELVAPILEKTSGLKAGKDFYLSFAPERTAEGVALQEMRRIPQIIGGLDEESVLATKQIFDKVCSQIIQVDSLEAAEIIKSINNSYRDLTFAFANEVALICDAFNLDAHEIIQNANFNYSRSNIPLPSPGVGGYCLTKDPYILIDAANKAGINPQIIPAARSVNEFMPKHVFEKISQFAESLNKPLAECKIFILGFAFKGWPETADTRFSPTLDVLSFLKMQTNNIFGFDTMVAEETIKSFGVKYTSYEDGFNGADCIIIMNNHPAFKKLDISRLLETTNKPSLFFDTWHLFEPTKIMGIRGVKYSNLGFSAISDDSPGRVAKLNNFKYL